MIDKPASHHSACKCELKNGKCKAEVVPCKEPDSVDCHFPNNSKEYCEQAEGGDCSGYYCDCKKANGGGCYLSKPAPKGRACTCTSNCKAKIGECLDDGEICKYPDVTKEACENLEHRNRDCKGYICECKMAENGGCKIKEEAPNGLACKCELDGDKCKTEGEAVKCRNPLSSACKKPGKELKHCQQAADGDCSGYMCECAMHEDNDGCYLLKPAMRGTKCKCVKKRNVCEAEVEECEEEEKNDVKCMMPGISKEYCMFADGDCSGYICDCEYDDSEEGCKITEDKQAPKNQACRCKMVKDDECQGEVVNCLDKEDDKCKDPDDSLESCIQGGGNCAGYEGGSREECKCQFHGQAASGFQGCFIKKRAPTNKACLCKLNDGKCRGEVVECNDPRDPKCRKPDTSKKSCNLSTLKDGDKRDCEGYNCDCEFEKGGCKIKFPAPPHHACKCEKMKGKELCTGTLTECEDESSSHCKSPGKDKEDCEQAGSESNCKGYESSGTSSDTDTRDKSSESKSSSESSRNTSTSKKGNSKKSSDGSSSKNSSDKSSSSSQGSSSEEDKSSKDNSSSDSGLEAEVINEGESNQSTIENDQGKNKNNGSKDNNADGVGTDTLGPTDGIGINDDFDALDTEREMVGATEGSGNIDNVDGVDTESENADTKEGSGIKSHVNATDTESEIVVSTEGFGNNNNFDGFHTESESEGAKRGSGFNDNVHTESETVAATEGNGINRNVDGDVISMTEEINDKTSKTDLHETDTVLQNADIGDFDQNSNYGDQIGGEESGVEWTEEMIGTETDGGNDYNRNQKQNSKETVEESEKKMKEENTKEEELEEGNEEEAEKTNEEIAEESNEEEAAEGNEKEPVGGNDKEAEEGNEVEAEEANEKEAEEGNEKEGGGIEEYSKEADDEGLEGDGNEETNNKETGEENEEEAK